MFWNEQSIPAYKNMVSSIRTTMLIVGRLERTETNLIPSLLYFNQMGRRVNSLSVKIYI